MAAADSSVRRRICFTTPLKPQPFGPKQAECIEDYQLVARDADSFHVSMAATTPNVSRSLAILLMLLAQARQ